MASPTTQASSLPEFLAAHPWEAQWTRLGAPMNYLWTWEFAVAPEALWPHLVDTSTFNRKLGLGPMVFEERAGRLNGRSGSGISYLEWEEVPWQWDYLQSFGNARIYSQGFARYVRSRYQLSQPRPGTTLLQVYFGWIPRTALGRWAILPWTMRWLEGRYGEVLRELVESIHHAPPAPALVELSEVARTKISAIRAQLIEEGWEARLLDTLLDRLRTGTDDELYRIRVRALARHVGRPVREVLRAFLQATRLGLFTLTWDVICPHCRGLRQEMAHLGDVPKRGACDACRIDFDTTGVNALEVTFHVHPSIRRIEKQAYCAAEPAKRPHIRIQQQVDAGQSLTLPSALGEGRYRLRLMGTFDYQLLSVAAGQAAHRVEWRSEDRGAHFEVGPSPELVLSNHLAEPRYFVVEETREDQDALRPSDLFTLQEFRDLFSEEAVAIDVQLDVGTQVLFLTDIVGSTQYYETVGDSVAFAHVKRHFVKAFEVIQAHEGAVVKTMGDAVMAVFAHPGAALQAAVKLQEQFRAETPDSPVRIRASLHVGPCLAVNLNSHIDYFGSTVNFCAKLQGLAGAGQIVFTEPFRNDPAVAELLSQREKPPEELEFSLKWHERASRVYRIEVL